MVSILAMTIQHTIEVNIPIIELLDDEEVVLVDPARVSGL
jgi:hypothetical protein